MPNALSENASKIRQGLWAEISVASSGAILVEWQPSPPAPGSLTRQEMDRYFVARDEALAEMARAMGKGVLMMDTNGRIRAIGADGSVKALAQ